MSSRSGLIIDGVDLYETYGLITTNESALSPPKLKRYEVDVPGSNGLVDLSDAISGAQVFEDRECNFVLSMNTAGQEEFERIKTQVSNRFHGRKLDFEVPNDPGYVYNGRFEIDEYYSQMHLGVIKLSVRAAPYKFKETYTYKFNGAGGVELTLPVGSKRVCPIIEVQRKTIVTHNGRSWTLNPGTFRIRDLWISQGESTLLVNTYPGYSETLWVDDADETWAVGANETWAEEFSGGNPLQEYPSWTLDADQTWAAGKSDRWIDELYPVEPGNEFMCYIQYDWEDL